MVGLVAGIVKGIVGFALPVILISGLSTIMAPEVALAALILPTLVANVFQALRQGVGAAWASVLRFRVFLGVGGVMMVLAAQFVLVLPETALFLIIGVPVVALAIVQLSGWVLNLQGASQMSESIAGAITGVMGGLSGIWGAPTVTYLTAINTPKDDQIRIQGVIFGLGSVVLVIAHLQSGVLNAATAPFSALMIIPAMIGVWIGNRIQHRIDQVMFRKVTLWVLLIVGLNLIRRGVSG